MTDTWIYNCPRNCLNLSIYGIMLFKFTFNSFIFAFRLNRHTFQNQSCESRKSKIRKWKKLNDSVLNLFIDNLIHNNKFKMNKGNDYTYTNELAFAMVMLIP